MLLHVTFNPELCNSQFWENDRKWESPKYKYKESPQLSKLAVYWSWVDIKSVPYINEFIANQKNIEMFNKTMEAEHDETNQNIDKHRGEMKWIMKINIYIYNYICRTTCYVYIIWLLNQMISPWNVILCKTKTLLWRNFQESICTIYNDSHLVTASLIRMCDVSPRLANSTLGNLLGSFLYLTHHGGALSKKYFSEAEKFFLVGWSQLQCFYPVPRGKNFFSLWKPVKKKSHISSASAFGWGLGSLHWRAMALRVLVQSHLGVL